jgi:SAM-dependent methyltransferase
MPPEVRKQAVAGVFTRSAATYDSVVPFFKHFGERIAANVGMHLGDTVLDVACGLGAVLLPSARTLGDSGHVTGVDLSFGMIDGLNQRISAASLANADARIMDAEALDFPDASFDAVTCAFGIMFMPRPEVALREFHRVLRPEGRAAVAVWGEGTPNLGFLGELSPEFGGMNLETGVTPPWGSDAGLAAMLDAAGFGDVEVVTEVASFVYADAETWWRTQLSHGARVYWDTVPESNRDSFREAALHRYAEIAGSDGQCTFVQRARIALGRA